ncbi:type III-A CRISPR-associated RAMP protein Csm4 [Staphylococcus debuckii]|uniref:type III-A CRISPR-associated RAMP protein Csm4 n=1 Tax=Staphylococcus debuckii TaxID=2044912 RepID=UPI001F0B984B|nr:type III-A CRISPR-associated RAMP protein Csm4 [Staphylococcus debuckii]
MSIKIYKLHFTTPVHFGEKRLSDSQPVIAADTLFSALFIETLNLGLDTDFLLNDLKISDTFPFFKDNYYFPKPLMKIESQHKDETNYKVFKKLKFLPVNQFNSYIAGEIDSTEAERITSDFQLGEKELLTKVSLQNNEKEGGDAEPYSVGLFRYHPDAGLYFIAKGSENALNSLNEVIDALQYSGIGGKRSAGYGQFECRITSDEKVIDLLTQQKGEIIYYCQQLWRKKTT